MKGFITRLFALFAIVGAGESLALTGKQVYDNVCSGCHRTGLLGAPKFGDKAAWGPRIEQGVEVLMTHALEGKMTTAPDGKISVMPPRGGCKPEDCSDDDIRAGVQYMIDAVQ